MAKSPETVSAAAEQTSFELEHFELTGGDRLELSGRWFGVRGRRFMRPTLTLFGHGEKSRALADLEHKPWSAEEGELWTAAFPWHLDGDGVLEVELAVAPDIAVTLAPPKSLLPPAGSRAAPAPRVAAKPPPPSEHARAQTLRDEALRRAELAQTELASALSRRDAAVGKLDAVIDERDQALAERDQAVAKRDQAVAERDQAVAERDQALAERERALAERERALAERGRAAAQRNQAVRERERLLAEKAEALSARDAALTRLEHVQTAAEDRLAGLREQIESERAEARAVESHAAATAPPRAAAISTTPAASRRRRPPDWLMRAVAVMVLLATVIALAIILQSAA